MMWKIHALSPHDAPAVAGLVRRFADYMRNLGDIMDHNLTAEAILRDGFGPNPAFAGLVAESEGEIVGYLLYHLGYDPDNAARNLHVIDLYVDDGARRQGIGRALMSEAARICREAGGTELFWALFSPNRLAGKFYEGLGARYTRGLAFMKIDAGAL